MSANVFQDLLPHDRALVALAVLLDGEDAARYVALVESKGERLEIAAAELMQMEFDIRLAFAGTMLRRALAEMK